MNKYCFLSLDLDLILTSHKDIIFWHNFGGLLSELIGVFRFSNVLELYDNVADHAF